jgi:hypothetical protein
MRFCTAINCMDGRVQLPVITYLRDRFEAAYVDSITEPGPERILALREDPALVRSILARVGISIQKHVSAGIAVAAHHDCAGNPASRGEQSLHLRGAVRFLRRQYPGIPVIALWVDDTWHVQEIDEGTIGRMNPIHGK